MVSILVQGQRGPFLLLRYIKLIRSLSMKYPNHRRRMPSILLLLGLDPGVLRRMLLNLVRTPVISLLLSTRFKMRNELSIMIPKRNLSSPMGLYEDLGICSYHACKELISHLASPAEDKVLSSLTNYEVVRHTYHSLGRSILSQAEMLKRHEQLNSEYVDLYNRSQTQLEELNCLQNDVQREMQLKEGLSKNLTLFENAHSQCSDRERELMDMLKDIEKGREDWRQTASDQVERIKKLEDDIGPKSKHLSDAEERVRVLEGEKIEFVGRDDIK
ncbi:hypothetical protein Tco_0428627 [Tanacetum coccineum]